MGHPASLQGGFLYAKYDDFCAKKSDDENMCYISLEIKCENWRLII